MAVGIYKQEQQRSARMANFFTRLRLDTCVNHVEEHHILPAGCVTAP